MRSALTAPFLQVPRSNGAGCTFCWWVGSLETGPLSTPACARRQGRENEELLLPARPPPPPRKCPHSLMEAKEEAGSITFKVSSSAAASSVHPSPRRCPERPHKAGRATGGRTQEEAVAWGGALYSPWGLVGAPDLGFLPRSSSAGGGDPTFCHSRSLTFFKVLSCPAHHPPSWGGGGPETPATA